MRILKIAARPLGTAKERGGVGADEVMWRIFILRPGGPAGVGRVSALHAFLKLNLVTANPALTDGAISCLPFGPGGNNRT